MSIVIVVPLIFDILVFGANSVPAAVVTKSPTFISAVLETTNEVVVAFNVETVLVIEVIQDPFVL